MSAVHPFCPWRGPLIDPSMGMISRGSRKAAAFAYSNIPLDAYVGPAVVGAYNLSGKVVNTLLTDRGGIYNLTGKDVAFRSGFLAKADVGSYLLTGKDVTLTPTTSTSHRRMSAIHPFSPWRGVLVDATRPGTTEPDRAAAAFAYSNIAPLGFNAADPGSYVLTGKTAGFIRIAKMPAAVGAFALTGKDASVLAKRGKKAGIGAYVETGQTAGLIASLLGSQTRMSALHPGSPWRGALVNPADPGFSSRNREAAAFLYAGINPAAAPGTKFVVASAGSYALSGQVVDELAARRLTSAVGDYSLVGKVALFPTKLAADAGVYQLSGFPAQSAGNKAVSAQVGTYILTGKATGALLSAEAGNYSLIGSDVKLLTPLEYGVYQLVGASVTFRIELLPGFWISASPPIDGTWVPESPLSDGWTPETPPVSPPDWTSEPPL